MSEKLRVGVIGCGFIGALHARIMYELANVELVAVSDVYAPAAEQTAKAYKCTAYISYEEMIQKEELDAVSITVRDDLHAKIAICAAEKGLKILLEKPIAPTYAEAKSIDDAVEANKDKGARLMVAQVLHFMPQYAELRDRIQSGAIGEISHMFLKRTNPRSSGGISKAPIFFYIGVHDIEMMCAYAQSAPRKVYCQKVSKINKAAVADREAEDAVFLTVTYENGSIGVVELSWCLPDNSALGINTYAEVVGARGMGIVDIHDQGIAIYTDAAVEFPDANHWPECNGEIVGGLRDELDHFVKASLKGDEYVVKTENALTAARIIDACFKSIETGMPVDIA